ncbi:MAG: hypothetical protein HY738_22380 [Bacteroidia bacterium]|nr:hypothetical protein [Bacteroidia bacterium]
MLNKDNSQTYLLNMQNEYAKILAAMDNLGIDQVVKHLIDTLPFLWADIYQSQSERMTDICRIQYGSFEYIFDDYATLEKKGIVPVNPKIESRLIAAFGKSPPPKKQRDDYRLRGWVGKTETYFGNTWDKGHFIGHSIGGNVDGLEINVFLQRRDLNRGWSEAGKRFRKMEEYCFKHSGTFCFNRPIYFDQTSRPAFYEFGILKLSHELWVECFDNKPNEFTV